MEKRRATEWFHVRHATMFMEAGSCRWAEVSVNSCDDARKEDPATSVIRVSAPNATRERMVSTERRVASHATLHTRTRRAKICAVNAIPSEKERCSIATVSRREGAVPATKCMEAGKMGMKR